MSKKPASLTSDLLARKGDAGPSSVDPISRVTLSPGRQPHLSGIGVNSGPSLGLYASPATERPDMHEIDEEERPRAPEPEIIYTPEEEDGGGRARLIAGAFVGIALLGGVLVALSLNEGDKGVAPVSPTITAAPEQTAPAAPQTAQAPAPSEARVPGTPETAVPDAAADLRPATPEAAAPASGGIDVREAPVASAPQSIVPPAAAPQAAPEANVPQSRAEAPAAAPEPAPVQAAAPAAAPASGGAWLVQIMALRDEAGAKSAWAALQKKHPSLLGNHALDVERADLGDKGVYYRVRAAGFETKSAAQSTCAGLKAAGQDCLVKSR